MRPQYSPLVDCATSIAVASLEVFSPPAPRGEPPGCRASATKATNSAVLIAAFPLFDICASQISAIDVPRVHLLSTLRVAVRTQALRAGSELIASRLPRQQAHPRTLANYDLACRLQIRAHGA